MHEAFHGVVVCGVVGFVEGVEVCAVVFLALYVVFCFAAFSIKSLSVVYGYKTIRRLLLCVNGQCIAASTFLGRRFLHCRHNCLTL